jgi:phospholipid-binding lipoprotein MlaA
LLITALLVSGFTPALAQDSLEDDPWEPFNRDMYAFNILADKFFSKPAASAYKAIMPDIAERAVGRVFNNLGDFGSAINNLAQGKYEASATNIGRFLVNSTFGAAGLFDFADNIGMEKEEPEDFGQTLAVWGVDTGPYLVLPFLGPSTLRDASAKIVDSNLQPHGYLENVGARNALKVADILSIRARYIDIEKTVPEKDPYSFVRDAYLQRRAYQVLDGEVVDDFGTDESDDFLD